jgi:hypothetical protein
VERPAWDGEHRDSAARDMPCVGAIMFEMSIITTDA